MAPHADIGEGRHIAAWAEEAMVGQVEEAIESLVEAAAEVPEETVIKLLGDPQTIKLGKAVQLVQSAPYAGEGPVGYLGQRGR